MASSLTYGSLRGLARLYRNNVDGAAEMLSAIIDTHAHALPEILGFPLKNLERLREHEDPVEVLVATIEGAPRVARDIRDRLHFETAAAMAVRLAETAVHRPGGHHALDVALLGEMLARYPGRIVTFGPRGSVGAGRLRAVVRELRNVLATSVVVTSAHVVIAYEGERARGLIKLVLHEPVVDDLTLVVPLGVVTASTEPAREQEHPQSPQARALEHEPVNRPRHEDPSCPDDAPGAVREAPGGVDTPGTVLEARRRPRLRPLPAHPDAGRHMAVRFIEALASAVLGGGP